MAPARSFVKAAAKALFGALVAIAAGVSFGVPKAHAQAASPGGWSLCNQSSFIVEAAVGRPNQRQIFVKGWHRMLPGECKVVVTAPMQRGVYYLYAQTSAVHRGGRRQWGGVATLCVDPRTSFEFSSPPKCEQAGLQERSFREVRINKTDSWRTVIAEAQPYSLDRARVAGLTRLLADAGYEARGVTDARRIDAAIQRFIADAKLPTNASREQLMDRLAEAARQRGTNVGLTFVNRTQGKLWIAIARRRGEGWESRGWWTIGASDYVRAIDDPLLNGTYFVHAILETPEGDRFLASDGETFCTSRTRFAILGREDCDKRFYDNSIFTAFQTNGREGMQLELFEKDFLAPGLKPRRAPNSQIAREDAAASNIVTSARPGALPETGETIDRGVVRGAPQVRQPGQQGSIPGMLGIPAQRKPGERVSGAIPAPTPSQPSTPPPASR
jgi:uncharacterized membrane protein